MSARKSERLMNLVIALVVSTGYLSKDRIRSAVEGYRDQGDEAFNRMFERDKEELREIGVEIETGSHDPFFGDELGYRIRRDAYELPDIALEPDEAAVVGLAARVWQQARLADATASALLKLRAAGQDVEPGSLAGLEPRLAASEAAFEPLWDAVVTRTPVTFDYRRPGRELTHRDVEPWRVLSWHGRWYLLGRDRGRDAPRLFRLSRVSGDVRTTGGSGDYEVPPDLDVERLAAELFPPPATRTATLRVREGAGVLLRRGATSTEPLGDGWDRVEVPFGAAGELAEEVVATSPDVVVEGPPEVRDRVVDALRRLAGTAAA